jgi:predicted DNA-binding transcriptional regulator AlpA
VRYSNLLAAGIISNRPQLDRMIATEGFPPGRLLSERIRVWSTTEIEEWLDTRPVEREQRQESQERA